MFTKRVEKKGCLLHLKKVCEKVSDVGVHV
jgi:hypothetical protein